MSLFQALSQVISVAAIFPFLALATDPGQFSQSSVGQFIESVSPAMSHDQLLIIAGCFLVVALFFANGASLYGEYYRARFIWSFAHWLRMRMLNRMNSRPYGWFLQQNSSVLTKKVTQDVMIFTSGVLGPIIDGVSRILIIVLLLVTIFSIEPRIALIVASFLGVFYLLIFFWLGGIRKYFSNALKVHWRRIFHHVGQFISGIKPIKVNSVGPEFLRRIEEHSSEQSRLQAWLSVIGNGPRYLIEFLAFALMILLVLIENIRGQDPLVLLPSLGLISMAGYRLLPAMQMLYSQMTNIETMRYALDEVYDELLEAEEVGDLVTNAAHDAVSNFNKNDTILVTEPLLFESDINLAGVGFKYPNTETEVFKDLSLCIPKKSSVAFIGKTGSGKSTLIDLILGLHRPTSGHLLIDGQPLDSEERISTWQRLIGYVPQDIFLTDDTIAHNIAFGIPDEYRDDERMRKVVAMAQLQSFIEKELPEGYESLVGERGVRLSAGQRQRIALARALYRDPQVLILDEATSALDNETEERFMDVIYALVSDLTILIVAHRLPTLSRVGRIFRLKNATIQLESTIDAKK